MYDTSEQINFLSEELHNKRIFITGGTGFFGSALLEMLSLMHQKTSRNFNITLLTRNKKNSIQKYSHFKKQMHIKFYEGDIRNIIFPNEKFDYVIHGATEASVKLNMENPQLMFDTIVQGMENILNFAQISNARKFLFISSGAVYGKQPENLFAINEDFPINSNSDSSYVLGKRIAEKLCFDFGLKNKCEIKIARCFAFVGPYLPLNGHFAIGNFILNGLNKNPIIIKGDGTPLRSYLYTSDLAIWLWTILLRGRHLTPYNVGSDKAFSIREIAHTVAKTFNPICEVKIMKTPDLNLLPERYIPCVDRAKNELSLFSNVHLIDAINFTKDWYLTNAQIN